MGWVTVVMAFLAGGTVGMVGMAVMAMSGRVSDAEDRHLQALARATEKEAS